MAPANAGRTYLAAPLCQHEVEALLQAASSTVPGLRAQALMAVCWRAAARVSEALHLEVGDVDMASGDLHLRVTKGGKPRRVALDPIGLGLVLRWLNARARLTGTPGSGFVFCTSSGKPLTTSAVRRLVARLGRQAGPERRAHAHALRHSFAVQAVRAGLALLVVQAALGHASLATTDRYVRHVAPEELLKAMRTRVWASQDAVINPIERT